jgi:hypothetical protein
VTPRQAQVAEAFKQAGSIRGAARALGIDPATVRDSLQRIGKSEAQPALSVQSERQAAKAGKRILVLPDVQAKDGTDFSYLKRIGTYMVDKKPDIVVCIGDFADMPSLSSYDKGKRSAENKRYKLDIDASHEAMSAFVSPMVDYNDNARRNGLPRYSPSMLLTLGNHEDRISRAVNDDAKLEGTLSVKALEYEAFGWDVAPFLETVIVEGVAFSHYFVTGVMGRPAGTAAAQLRVASMSCFAGHQQGKQIAYGKRADGAILTSIISGSCYEHDESFLSPQMNRQHWRGFFVLNDTRNGAFDEMPISLNYINGKYPDVKVARDYAKVPMAEMLA